MDRLRRSIRSEGWATLHRHNVTTLSSPRPRSETNPFHHGTVVAPLDFRQARLRLARTREGRVPLRLRGSATQDLKLRSWLRTLSRSGSGRKICPGPFETDPWDAFRPCRPVCTAHRPFNARPWASTDATEPGRTCPAPVRPREMASNGDKPSVQGERVNHDGCQSDCLWFSAISMQVHRIGDGTQPVWVGPGVQARSYIRRFGGPGAALPDKVCGGLRGAGELSLPEDPAVLLEVLELAIRESATDSKPQGTGRPRADVNPDVDMARTNLLIPHLSEMCFSVRQDVFRALTSVDTSRLPHDPEALIGQVREMVEVATRGRTSECSSPPELPDSDKFALENSARVWQGRALRAARTNEHDRLLRRVPAGPTFLLEVAARGYVVASPPEYPTISQAQPRAAILSIYGRTTFGQIVGAGQSPWSLWIATSATPGSPVFVPGARIEALAFAGS
jgi:hypothetical protein